MRKLCLLLVCMALIGCGQKGGKEHTLSLEGPWTLTQTVSPMENVKNYPDNGMTFGRIYDGDSVCHTFQLVATASGIVIVPGETFGVTLIRRGAGRYLYLEDGEPRPLNLIDDTTVTIQQYGYVRTWVRAADMTPQRIKEIRDIIIADSENDANEQVRHYVLSTTERELRRDRSLLIYALAAVALLLVWGGRMLVAKQRRIRRAEVRIRQMAEEREQRAQTVTDAMHSVETAFFASDYYQSLRRTLIDGGQLKEADWQEAERRLQQVYPGFTNKLRSLWRMSELEYQVCLLIKLRFTPKEMSQLLFRDVSTISTTRSRLYQKVFGRKGSSKDWDDVVMGIGA